MCELCAGSVRVLDFIDFRRTSNRVRFHSHLQTLIAHVCRKTVRVDSFPKRALIVKSRFFANYHDETRETRSEIILAVLYDCNDPCNSTNARDIACIPPCTA